MNAWIICGENSPAAEGDFPQQDRAESQSEACHQYASNTPHPKFFLVAPTGDISKLIIDKPNFTINLREQHVNCLSSDIMAVKTAGRIISPPAEAHELRPLHTKTMVSGNAREKNLQKPLLS
jgi:hypothetical protein